MIWILIWKSTLIIALILFVCVSIIVMIGGAREIFHLFNQD